MVCPHNGILFNSEKASQWYMQKLERISRHFLYERTSLKRVHTTSFHLCDILKRTKLYDREYIHDSQGLGEEEGVTTKT